MRLSEEVAAQKRRKCRRLVDKHKLWSVKGTKQAEKAHCTVVDKGTKSTREHSRTG